MIVHIYVRFILMRNVCKACLPINLLSSCIEMFFVYIFVTTYTRSMIFAMALTLTTDITFAVGKGHKAGFAFF